MAVAALLLAGCRKEAPVAAERGTSPVPTASATPPEAPDRAGPVETPAPRPPEAPDGAAPVGTPAPPRPPEEPDGAGPGETPAPPRPPDPAAQGSGAKPTGKAPGSAPLPQQGQPCAEGRCAAGLTCVDYYGIAGPRGPRFTSCEIRCGSGGPCPAGQQCITIADGPGTVCRP
jgi:hypothetical protein